MPMMKVFEKKLTKCVLDKKLIENVHIGNFFANIQHVTFRKFSHLCSRKRSSRKKLVQREISKTPQSSVLEKFPGVFSKKLHLRKILNLRKVSQTLIWWILEDFTQTGVLENMSLTKFLYKNFEIMSTYVSFAILRFQRL